MSLPSLIGIALPLVGARPARRAAGPAACVGQALGEGWTWSTRSAPVRPRRQGDPLAQLNHGPMQHPHARITLHGVRRPMSCRPTAGHPVASAIMLSTHWQALRTFPMFTATLRNGIMQILCSHFAKNYAIITHHLQFRPLLYSTLYSTIRAV